MKRTITSLQQENQVLKMESEARELKLTNEASPQPSSILCLCRGVDRPIASCLPIPPSWTVLESVTPRGKAWADAPQTWYTPTWPRCMIAPPFWVEEDTHAGGPKRPSQPTVCFSVENQESCDTVRHASGEMLDSAGRASRQFGKGECSSTPTES